LAENKGESSRIEIQLKKKAWYVFINLIVMKPKEESLFYIGVVFYTVSETNQVSAGVVRAELVLEGKELFYKINALDPVLIPCGRIVFRN
jgi:hypothetical protein